MSGPKKLISSEKNGEVAERQKATLLRNDLISGNSEIAEAVLKKGRIATFSKGDKIIERGGN